jgi:hypothetical protein
VLSLQVVVGWVPVSGSEQDEEEQSLPFCDCLSCAQAGVRPRIVVKEKEVLHVSVRMNCMDAL